MSHVTTSSHATKRHPIDESEVKLAYQWLDPNNTGHITHADIKQLSQLLGLNYTHKHIKTMLKQQNSISYTQLLATVRSATDTTSQHDIMQAAYSTVTAQTPHLHNIANILLNSGRLDSVTENDLTVLQQICDTDINNNMSLKSFEQILHRHKHEPQST